MSRQDGDAVRASGSYYPDVYDSRQYGEDPRARSRQAAPPWEGRPPQGGPPPGSRVPRSAPPAAAREYRTGRGSRRPEGGRRQRRWGRMVLAMSLTVAVVVTGAALLEYRQLNGNLRSVPLFAGVSGDAGTEKPDPFGHTPINLLVIGSDARNTAANCALGHDCRGGGQNADVELLVHVAADRTNASVLSIPRDTVTMLPSCRNPRTGQATAARRGQINASLADGPGCTVAAVHQLTGIPIDHFAMVDFAGVVSMSDAAGGVPVCVSSDVYDPYSHLKLTAGTHVLKGLAALEFVRSRHAFGDGSDLGRTYAQHLFLASMIRTLKSTGVVTNPGALLSLAQAATQALTVDDGLGSISQLLGLARDVDKVPPKRITFATMPTSPDPANPNRVVPGPAAPGLFQAIAADTALSRSTVRAPTASAGASGTTPGATPGGMAGAMAGGAGTTADRAGVAVRVLNGTAVTGRASGVARSLVASGFSPATSTGTTGPAARTTLRYPSGQAGQARAVADALRLPVSALSAGPSAAIVLTIGRDWTSGATYPAGGTANPAAAGDAAGMDGAAGSPAVVPAAAHAQTADQSAKCAPVSTARTVALKGVPMTPAQAFRRSPGVPLSAR